MHRLRRDLRERKHHERTFMHSGMWQYQFRSVEDSVTVHQDVDVQRSRLVRSVSSATVNAFDVQKFGQQICRHQVRSDRYHHVEIFGLVFVDTERLGFVNRRQLNCITEMLNCVDGGSQIGDAIT